MSHHSLGETGPLRMLRRKEKGRWQHPLKASQYYSPFSLWKRKFSPEPRQLRRQASKIKAQSITCKIINLNVPTLEMYNYIYLLIIYLLKSAQVTLLSMLLEKKCGLWHCFQFPASFILALCDSVWWRCCDIIGLSPSEGVSLCSHRLTLCHTHTLTLGNRGERKPSCRNLAGTP